MSHYTYLALNLFSIAFPFAFSFTARSGFSKRFGRVFAAIAVVALPMLVWDAWFTARGVWGFNPDYYLGVRLFGLPLEEILFFFCIPFACLFIYDAVRKTPALALPERPVRAVASVLGVALLLLAGAHADRDYTALCFVLAAPFPLALAAGFLRDRVGHIATAYLFHLIPFFLVNGILTALPVVWYNDAENLGIRMGTIPVEDAAYSMILLFGSIFVMEWKAGRR
jgi:lycopene cyclase domain-containing protein